MKMAKLSKIQKEELAKYKRLADNVFYAHRMDAQKEYRKLKKMYGLK